ncbi:unnamed protein product [Trichobilharzia regenti]|nr:unnamed protein product [Trichobilharzia regenti]
MNLIVKGKRDKKQSKKLLNLKQDMILYMQNYSSFGMNFSLHEDFQKLRQHVFQTLEIYQIIKLRG